MAAGYAELGLFYVKLDDSLPKQDAFAQGGTDPGSMDRYKGYVFGFPSFGAIIGIVNTNKYHLKFGSVDADTPDQTAAMGMLDKRYEAGALRLLIPQMDTKVLPSFITPGTTDYPVVSAGTGLTVGTDSISVRNAGLIYLWQSKLWFPAIIDVSGLTANGSTFDNGAGTVGGTATFFGQTSDMYMLSGTASPEVSWTSGF